MPTTNHQVPFHPSEKNKSERVSYKEQYWNTGHGRAPLRVDENAYAIDTSAHERKRTRRIHHFAIMSLLLVFINYWYLSSWDPVDGRISATCTEAAAEKALSSIFDWAAHPPSKALNWTDCYDRFQCARLAVPLLYSEPSGEEAAVALIKSPARYPPSHEKYRGPILFNPGGPGGSGVSIILMFEQAFRAILGDEFDLVGFDPRGVGFTTPVFSVFNDQVEAGKFYVQLPININSSVSALGDAYSRTKIFAKLVEDRAKFVAERVSTPIVARDMLNIVKAFGQDKLQYWGFSYGTILGATFAAMFPNNVGRLIIDGVVDTDDYYNGLWANNLRDTDTALLDIYQQCVAAGPAKCPIYENTTSLVKARVDCLLDGLKTAPLVYYNSTSLGGDYEVVDYSLVKSVIFTALYNTHGQGANFTSALVALEQGDPSQIYSSSVKVLFNALVRCRCPAPGETPPHVPEPYEIVYVIGCGDIITDGIEDLEQVREAYEEIAKTSSFADTWGPRVFCSNWELRAKERFNGSFQQTTSHPLLLIGNIADPVTPLWNAQKVSEGFKDSVVLTQNSSGHCSVAATSICTFKAVREYFVSGTLPEKGTVCETQSSIFGEKALNLEALSAEDRELVTASEMLRENYFIRPFGDA